MASMKKIVHLAVVALVTFPGAASMAQTDTRQLVDLPPMMSQHICVITS